MVAIASLDSLMLDGQQFLMPVGLPEFTAILGQPNRTIEPSPPAPYGHRNNHIHLYDHLGLYLNEHHATGLIGEVTFVLDPTEVPFPVGCPFAGRLRVGEVMVYPGMREGLPESLSNGLPWRSSRCLEGGGGRPRDLYEYEGKEEQNGTS
jgi:hypothetical protein